MNNIKSIIKKHYDIIIGLPIISYLVLDTLFGKYSRDIKASATAMFFMYIIMMILYRSKVKLKNLYLWYLPVGIFLMIIITFIFDKLQLY